MFLLLTVLQVQLARIKARVEKNEDKWFHEKRFVSKEAILQFKKQADNIQEKQEEIEDIISEFEVN